MRPFFLALLLLLHGLAHAGAGIWAAGRAPAWLVTPLWLVAMPGFMAAALAIFGVERLRPRAEGVTLAATLASAALLRLAGVAAWSLIGLMIGLAFCGLVRWWARRAHPEIRTPTLTTGGHPVVPEVPSLRERVGTRLGWALLGYTALLIVLRPWYQAWGTTAAERASPVTRLAGAGAMRYRADHAVTVRAPAERVWPWVAQIGVDRAGFYSYGWLERALGIPVRDTDSLVPAWQERAVGDLVRGAPPGFLGGRFGRDLGWRITRWDPPRVMVLEHWGVFVVEPTDSTTSRLRVHTRGTGMPSVRAIPLAPLGFYLFEPAHFLMERGMLLGIKARAERGYHAPSHT